MKLRHLALLVCAALVVSTVRSHAAPKPAKKPAPVPESVSVKDLAIREARKCDANHNGRIDASEMSSVRQAWKTNPKSYLYLFDDNSNQYLEDSELSKVKLGGGGQKKKKKK